MEGCDLRIGVYESFDTLCIYLESDAFGSGLERNFWVKYRIAILNQKYPERTEWKEASICTKTWNNSVLQFMKARRLTRQSESSSDIPMLCRFGSEASYEVIAAPADHGQCLSLQRM